MAAKRSVWGIDIGQAALKALKCRVSDDGESVVAESYDYVEYPKLLSSPEANPQELVQEALEQFLSRNETLGDEIAISVPGNTGLARFFKPPPVEAKVLPQLVEFEAKQQIPFPLDEVIWDWQSLGGAEVEGYQLDAEVGIFAMKREHVARALKPFQDQKLEPSTVQLSPLTVFNAVSHEALGDTGKGDVYDPDNPPPHTLVLSMGTETTDLIFTNGMQLWLRSVPIGGNHFTKILSKELKLTHAKAEQLKRHVMEAEDPKAVFQVMRPVFNDLVNEIQRSIRHYQTIDRKAKIEKVLLIGNASKLRGLSQYVEQNLGLSVSRLKKFDKLEGSEVVNAESFHANAAAFAGAYGLCLQGCGVSKLKTSLLPPEIITERIIKEKKPWAVAAVALVLLGFAGNAAFQVWRTWEVNPQRATADGLSWESAINSVNPVKSDSDTKNNRDKEQLGQLQHIRAMGEEVVGNADRKLLWLELLSALDVAMPDSSAAVPRGQVPDPKAYPFKQRTELYIESVEAQFFPDLSVWWTEPIKKRYVDAEYAEKGLKPPTPAAADTPVGEVPAGEVPADGTTPAPAEAAPVEPAPAAPAPASGDPYAAAPATTDAAAGTGDAGPKEQGWVVELRGHHFHNSDLANSGENYLRQTLIRQLKQGEITLPVPTGDPNVPAQPVTFTMKELGIEFPVIVVTSVIDQRYKIANPAAVAALGPGGVPVANLSGGVPGAIPGAAAGQRRPGTNGAAEDEEEEPEEPLQFDAPRYRFVVQFVWKETPLAKRLQVRKEAEEAAAAANPATETVEGEADSAVVDPTAVDPAAVTDPTAIDPAAAPVVDPATAPPTAVDPSAPGPVAPAVPPAAVDPSAAPGPVVPGAGPPAAVPGAGPPASPPSVVPPPAVDPSAPASDPAVPGAGPPASVPGAGPPAGAVPTEPPAAAAPTP